MLNPKRTRFFERIHLPVSLKGEASREERIMAAICHLSIFLNLYFAQYPFGGIALCALFYLLATGGAEYLKQQAGKALIFQLVILCIMLAGGALYRLLPDWLGNIILMPFGVIIWFIAILVAILKAVRCL